MKKITNLCLEKMKEKSLDGLIYATGANFQYLTKANEYYWQRCSMNNINGQLCNHHMPEALAYCDKEGNITVVCIPSIKHQFNGHHVVVSYVDQMEDTLSTIIKGKKIGIGFNCQSWLEETLKEVDPAIQTIYCEDLLNDIRCIKTDEEIKQLRVLAKFTDDAIMHVVKSIKKGMTQYDVEQMIMEYGLKNGMQDLAFSPTAGFKTRNTFTSEENFIFPRTSVLTDGTAIAFDVGYMNNGFCSDWGRTVYYKKAPQYIKDGYKALQAAQVHMVNSIIPNKTNINELYGFVLEEATKHGYQNELRFKDTGSLGHQIGIDCHEHPMLNNSVDFILKPGMVFCSEPKMMFENECYMRVEDMILVTETGAEFLTNFDRNLFEFNND